MAQHSHIEWTDHTWNPLLGCDKCSEGCKLCYAIRTAWRLQHNPNPKIAAAYAGLVAQRPDGSLNWTGKINLLPEKLEEPLHWKKPGRIFVNSQGDLFHPQVPDTFIDEVFAVMALCPQHVFQVLTKRPERMNRYFERLLTIEDQAEERITAKIFEREPEAHHRWPNLFDVDRGEDGKIENWQLVLPLDNVWLGVSVENQKAADERIPPLLSTPARVRFLSCEPLLSSVDLSAALELWHYCGSCGASFDYLAAREDICPDCHEANCMSTGYGAALRDQFDAAEGRILIPDGSAMHWVICGGESGAGARPMHPAWARSLRDQCQSAGVPFFFKQWGEWWPYFGLDDDMAGLFADKDGVESTSDHGPFPPGFSCVSPKQAEHVWPEHAERATGDGIAISYRIGKHAAGRLLDGREHSSFPLSPCPQVHG